MKRANAARVTGEGLVIVVSILLAFAIDAWWDGRKERQEEQRILAALAVDFTSTRETVVQTTALYEQARDSSFRLLGLLSEDLSRVSERELFTLIRWSLGAWSFEPRLTTYAQIIGSGSLGLIRSEALRGQMAIVIDEFDDVQDYYRELFRRATIVEDPFIIEHVPGYEMWQGKGGATFPSLPFDWDPNELRTREFASLLAVRQAWIIDVIGIGQDLTREIDVALELIRQAQEK